MLRRYTHVNAEKGPCRRGAAPTRGTRGQARTKLRARGGKETRTREREGTLPRERASHSYDHYHVHPQEVQRPKAGDRGDRGRRGCASVKRNGVPVPRDECVEAGGGTRFGARGVPPNHRRRRG